MYDSIVAVICDCPKIFQINNAIWYMIDKHGNALIKKR